MNTLPFTTASKNEPHAGARRTIVLGAGATGLATAFLLRRAGEKVTVLDAASQAGGLLATFEAGGQRLEHYYHHFFTHDAEIRWLLEQLGLSDKIIFRPGTMGVYRGGRLYKFDGALDLLRFGAMSWPARVRFGASSLLLSHRRALVEREDLSCLEWFDRWAGREATNAIWRPLMQIKFGAAAEEVPLSWMVGRLRQRARSRRGGGEQLGYLAGSLQTLVDGLVANLEASGVEMKLKTPVDELVVTAGSIAGVRAAGEFLPADRVVSTLPTSALAKLVAPHDSSYARQLDQIKYMGAICTVLALRESLSPIYWTNVADPGFDFGGVIEHTNLIPASDYGGLKLVYLSRYVAHDDPFWSLDDETILRRQLAQLERMYQRPIMPLLNQQWVFRASHAAPCVGFHFREKIPAFRAPVDGLFVGSMCHVYPDERSVNNSVRIAAELMRAMGHDGIAASIPTGLSMAGTHGHRPAQDATAARRAA